MNAHSSSSLLLRIMRSPPQPLPFRIRLLRVFVPSCSLICASLSSLPAAASGPMNPVKLMNRCFRRRAWARMGPASCGFSRSGR